MATHTHFDTEGEDAKLSALRDQEEEDLAQILSQRYGLTYTDFSLVSVNADALRLISETDARKAEVIAFEKTAKQVSVAIHNPHNESLPEVLKKLEARGFTLSKFMVSRKGLERGLARYTDLSFAQVSKVGTFDISQAELDKTSTELPDFPTFKKRLDETLAAKKGSQASRLLEQIVAGAYALKASDVHIEPEEGAVRLRLRLDGMLTDVAMLDVAEYRLINSRVKLLSGLKLNVANRAQDGRFTIQMRSVEIEVRTSVIPGNYGESLVLRVLDPSSIHRTFEEMGINPKLLARLREEVRRPNGMLLTTGPTGSGKTTTLYGFLREVHSPEVKIVTIEDPIEYHLTGIVQTQVNHEDYTFASGLRSILRQDPDVILIGEIRDAEVAETAIQAALTGHFVFSTLHTNNAAGTFPRLVDLKVDPKFFASAVSVSMAQRLVRTLDTKTKQPRKATDEEKRLMEKILATLTDPLLIPPSLDTVFDAVPGVEGETGYKGRLGVHEGIFMDEELGEMLRDNPSEGDIAKSTRRQGYPNMAQDGVLKVLQGITTFEELVRVVDMPR